MGLASTFRDPRPRRLNDAIEVTKLQIALRKSNLANGQHKVDAEAILDKADEALTKAAEACGERDIDSGFAFVNLARQLQIPLYDPIEVLAAKNLEAEMVTGRFPGWRGKAIEAQLTQVLATLNGNWCKTFDQRRAGLAEAWRSATNCGEERLRFGSDASLPGDPGLRRPRHIDCRCHLLGIRQPRTQQGRPGVVVVLAAALAGALGGSTSALQRTTRRGTTGTPTKVGYLLSALSRPVVGAIGGITVFLAVRGCATQTTDEQVPYVLLVSFGAGFFERLVVRDPRNELAIQSAAPTPGTAVVLPDQDAAASPPPPQPM